MGCFHLPEPFFDFSNDESTSTGRFGVGTYQDLGGTGYGKFEITDSL